MKKFTPIVTYIISGICLIVFAFIHLSSLSNTNTTIMVGCYYKPLIMAGEVWRLLTVGFVHVHPYHIFMNLVALYSLGMLLERMIGHLKYLCILFFSIISGSLWIYILDGNVLAVGLSAGLYGLMACEIYVFYLQGLLSNPRIRNQVIQMVIINLLINFIPGVSYSGHFGGFIGGLLISMLCIPLPKHKHHQQKVISAICLYLVGLGFFIKEKSYILSSEQYKLTDIDIINEYKSLGLNKYADYLINRLDAIYGDTDISTYMKGIYNYDTEKIY